SFNNLGSRYQAINEWELSKEYFYKALAIYESLGHGYYEALTYNNLASVYLHFEDYPKVIEYAKESYQG
ncbi:MAG: tetratricopeptide repeat protein, partial [Algicola sp.]|nr:tetratricopeptide repeat protein [Algicola sp.]